MFIPYRTSSPRLLLPTYSYNGLDTRVRKTENSVSNTFRRSGAYVTDPVLGDGTASYTPGVSRRTGTETRYFHTGLKNTDSLTNPGQTVAASRIYDAFGNVVSSSGTWSGPFGYAGNFGYQADASGLKLLGHRYYDPSTVRFLTRDRIKDGRNWYAYRAGEAAPTTTADPTGLLAKVLIGPLIPLGPKGWAAAAFLLAAKAVVSLYTASVVSETLTGPSIFEAATVRMGPGIEADSGAGTSFGTGSGTRTDPMYNKGEQDELRRLCKRGASSKNGSRSLERKSMMKKETRTIEVKTILGAKIGKTESISLSRS